MIIKSYDPKKKKSVVSGETKGNSFYRKVISKHFYVKGGGYCLSNDVLCQLNLLEIDNIFMKGKKGIYKSKFNDWTKYGQYVDEGHGDQICLSINRMEKVK